MITYIKGKLIEKTHNYTIIEINGIGYFINISFNTYNKLLPFNNNKEIILYTHVFIKEKNHILYGFFDKIEREIFRYLITINGIGPNYAILILSSLTPKEVVNSILNNKIDTFLKIKGIGIKNAKRIIIELKDKIPTNIYNKKDILKYNEKEDVLSALKVLGFAQKNAKQILDDIMEKKPELSTEDLIKETLKKLS
ncbi:MAG: Holliday junction branch migration protein RuvA [Candidatus Bostrichicola ureolyticus]|nr:MAG: Holliday junction branch migration protein RuvA [Candidatus Bostrichicola ureolyticus]